MTVRNCLIAAFAAAGLTVASDRASAQVSVTPGGVNATAGGTGAVVPFNGTGATFTAPGVGSYTVPNGTVMPAGGTMNNTYPAQGFTPGGYVTPGTTSNGFVQTGYAAPMSVMPAMSTATPYTTSSMYYPPTGFTEYVYPVYSTGPVYGTTMMTTSGGRMRRGLFRR